MKFGICTSCSDTGLDPASVARMVEAAGFETVTFGEHSHIPASRETPYPGPGGELPPGYERLLDLFVTMTCAALATTEIKIGTGILQIVQRDPIIAAKGVASVDRVSDGRVLLITGSSWNLEEMRNHGTEHTTRYELLEERVLAMREIWSEDEATFHGHFVNFDRIWSWPKPVQEPFPVLIGGNSSGIEQRALRAGTGWAPLDAPGMTDRVRAFFEDAGRLGVTTTATVVGAPPSSPKVLEDYADAGAERYLHAISIMTDEGELATELEGIQRLQAEFAGTP